MLVLSRRADEELIFPNVGIRIKVLRSQGNRVRLGIEAPDFVEVYRGEVNQVKPVESPNQSHHAFQNELNAVRLAMTLYERQMERGEVDSANQTFLRMLDHLRRTDSEWAPLHESLKQAASGPKVLVVDDDANERELLAGLLQMDGCQVQTASDGLEAIDVLKSATIPDVVMLDMQMPRLGGKETLAAIRGHEAWRQLLVFGISGSSPDELEIPVGDRNGVDDWFEKPLNPSILVGRTRQLLKTSLAVLA